MKWIGKGLFFVIVFIVSLEILLRIFHLFETTQERQHGSYVSYYNQHLPSHYFTLKKNADFQTTGEFSYRIHTNKDGFREKDLDTLWCNGKRKILVIGDSFTEGIGTSYDSSWVKIYESLLNKDTALYNVVNLGVANSDPFFESKIIQQKLPNYPAEKVFLVVNFSDIGDVITRGGNERFLPDGTTLFKREPWLENLYKHFFFVRFALHFVFQYDYTLLSPTCYKKKSAEAISKISDEISFLNEFCQKNKTDLTIIIHPYIDPYDMFLQKQTLILNLIPLLEKKHIRVINLFADFSSIINKSNYKKYAWPIDKHFKSLGYAYFAERVFCYENKNHPR